MCSSFFLYKEKKNYLGSVSKVKSRWSIKTDWFYKCFLKCFVHLSLHSVDYSSSFTMEGETSTWPVFKRWSPGDLLRVTGYVHTFLNVPFTWVSPVGYEPFFTLQGEISGRRVFNRESGVRGEYLRLVHKCWGLLIHTLPTLFYTRRISLPWECLKGKVRVLYLRFLDGKTGN